MRRWAPPRGESARRYAWPRIAEQVTEVYEKALEAPLPVNSAESGSRAAPASSAPTAGSAGLPGGSPPLDPVPEQGRGRRTARRLALGAAGALGIGLTAPSPRSGSASTGW